MTFLNAIKSLFKDPKGSFEFVKNALYTGYSGNPAKMMVHTGTIGWTLSSAAQLWNIMVSDKFTSDEKKFLIPQEALDAIVNIALFYGVTNGCKNLSGKLVSSGKLLSKEIREYVAKTPIEKKFKLGNFNTNLGKLYKNDQNFFKIYQPFKNGVDMTINTIACIIASNIITPYVRNYLGAIRQKQSIAKEKLQAIAAPPVLPAQNRFTIEDYKNKASLNSPFARTSSSMKI